jgi:putative transposase
MSTQKSRESQAVFRCTECQHVEHADVNAAKNVLAAGLAVTACGDLQPVGGSTKQEPAGNRKELLRHLYWTTEVLPLRLNGP